MVVQTRVSKEQNVTCLKVEDCKVRNPRRLRKAGGKDIKEGEQVKDEKQNATIQQPDETPAVLSDEEKDPSKAEVVTTKGTHKDILAGWVWLPCNRSKGVLRHFGTKGSFCRSSSIFFLDET